MCVPRAKFFDIIFGFWIFTRSMLENRLYFLVIKKQWVHLFSFWKKKEKMLRCTSSVVSRPRPPHFVCDFPPPRSLPHSFCFFSSSLSSTNASAPVEWEFLCNLPCGDHGYILLNFCQKKNSRLECPVTSGNINRLETHSSQDVVARYNNSVATPSIFESLIFEQIDLYGKTIITHVLHID